MLCIFVNFVLNLDVYLDVEKYLDVELSCVIFGFGDCVW